MLKPYMIPHIPEAGCDEAGRGPLAGAVFAAAVILPQDFSDERLNDSKQLNAAQRYELRDFIEKSALSWAVASMSAAEIDEQNILRCALLAMHRAIDQLTIRPQHILVDGNKWIDYIADGEVMAIPADTVVHGDATYQSIAAASVLAKTYRDDYMTRLAALYPAYGWEHNFGYPTAQHYRALQRVGISPYHRLSFNLNRVWIS